MINDALSKNYENSIMQIRPSISTGLRIASFVAAILVVGIHTNNSSLLDHPAEWNKLLHYWLCVALNQFAVPFFFAVSGFWFANGKYVNNKETLRDFYLGKVRTLLIPYLFWVVTSALLMNSLFVVLNISMRRDALFGTVFQIEGFWTAIDKVLAIMRTMPIYNKPMWYVRTLILFFLIAPVWKFFCKKSLVWLLLGVFLLDRMIEGGILPSFVALSPRHPLSFIIGIFIRVYFPDKWLFSSTGGGGVILRGWDGLFGFTARIHS